MENTNNGVQEYRWNDEVELRMRWDGRRANLEAARGVTIGLSEDQLTWLYRALDQKFGDDKDARLEIDHLLYLSGDITPDSVKELRAELLKVALAESRHDVDKRLPLTLFVNSSGGYCSEGYALMDTLEYVQGVFGVKVIGIVQGSARSMASVVLQACNERYIARYARMMLHEVQGGIMSVSLAEARKWLAEMEAANKQMARVYAGRNTQGHDDVEFWEGFLAQREMFLSAQECVDMGLADGVFDSARALSMAANK